MTDPFAGGPRILGIAVWNLSGGWRLALGLPKVVTLEGPFVTLDPRFVTLDPNL